MAVIDEDDDDDDARTFPASTSPLVTIDAQICASSSPQPLPPVASPHLLGSLNTTMSTLLQETVATTRGWSVSQLMALECDLRYVIRRCTKSGSQSSVLDVALLKTVRSKSFFLFDKVAFCLIRCGFLFLRNSSRSCKITSKW